MSVWLYQLNQKSWEPERYRLEIWEGERWAWSVGHMVGATEKPPRQGDTVVFFYAKTGGPDPGFYGWAVITEWLPGEGEDKDQMYFRPVAPSNHLKMDPWWDGEHGEAEQLADRIRGKVMMGTLWRISGNDYDQLRRAVARWLTGQDRIKSPLSTLEESRRG
jgi:hypothetical protein